ncbi:MAG: MBOAT family protein [Lachnospiraceae bacterium]|nr:MBOAT family protein [Lachnospiraceae bacterium]
MDMMSVKFGLFMLITVVLYYTLAKRKQWILLLAANLVFYLFSGPANMVFILITSVTTWGGAFMMEKLEAEGKLKRKNPELSKEDKKLIKAGILKKKRLILAAVLLINFGILAFLKYFRPIFMFVAPRLHMDPNALMPPPMPGNPPFQGLLLPLGISFYTFQSVGYLIDIYGAKYEAERNWFKYLTFVSFFPQLIQGPINRFDSLKKDLFTTHRLSQDMFRSALLRFAIGAMKKYALANVLAGSVSAILDNKFPGLSGITIVFGIFLYGVQQYADFSGGIDMAMAAAELLGIHMTENFRQPYFATSLGDFWRRWHISLGQWMRDYVFYPFALTKPMQSLGKNTEKALGKHMGRVLPACIANILVFFIVGIWHGAELHYILWGLYNGVVIALSDLFAPAFNALSGILHMNTKSKGFHVFRIIRTFIIVHIGWYFDRIIDFKTTLIMFKNTFLNINVAGFIKDFKELFLQQVSPWCIYTAIISYIIVIVMSVINERGGDAYKSVKSMKLLPRWAFYLLIFYLIDFGLIYGTATEGFMYAFF